MSDKSVVHGVIEADRLEEWAKTFNARGTGQDNPIVREVKAHFDGDGVTVRAVDAANVAMYHKTALAPRAFEAYDAPGQVTVGLNLETLIDRLGPADGDELVAFDVNMETRHLELQYGSTEMTIAMIDPESMRNEPDDPDLELVNEVTISGEQFGHAVEVSDMVSDHMRIKCEPDDRQVRFYARGDTDDASVIYGDEEVIDATVDKESESIYSVSYLEAFASAIPDDAEVRLRVDEEFPLRMFWDRFDGAFDVRATLAPRIQSN